MRKLSNEKLVRAAKQSASIWVTVTALATGVNVYNKVADKVNSSKGVNK